MANPRELAEQAFTLLQNALRDSESRVSELDAELKRQRQPKNRVEERADVLAHRLEGVEAECRRWEREAGNLEEILENERAKVQQLKKKLEVAESGPDRLTKKEVNFWRQRAEQFDAETREYKSRIASLKRELEARAELTEIDSPAQAPHPPEDPAPAAVDESAREEANALRQQLAARDAELATLQAGIAQLEVQEAQTAEHAAEHAALLVRHSELAAEYDTLAAKRDELAAERDELTAELARTRATLDENQQHASDVESASRRLAETVRERETRLVEASAELEQTHVETAAREARISALRDAEQAVRANAEQLRVALAERNAEMQAVTQEIAQQRQIEQQREAELQALRAEVLQSGDALQARSAEVEQLRGSLLAQDVEVDRLREGNDHLQQELTDLRSRADVADDDHRSQLEGLRNEVTRRDTLIAELQAHNVELERERTTLIEQQNEARAQMANLEAELKEEKECTANLSEIANERREALTRLEERVEEADERYEEAKWRLGKAQHFERLLRRRKGLIKAMIAALRAKSKANVALKAGLDGLRTFKATSEKNQYKLLARIDKLNAELKEAETTVAKRQGATQVNEDLQTAQERIEMLEERLNTQVDVIQTLEAELKGAKATQHSRDTHAAELQETRKQLEAQSEIIARLEEDADEQQRKLSKLRGSDSETARLRALEEKDKSLIDALQREVAQLRDILAQRELDAAAGDPKQRNGAIAGLSARIKEQETEIAKLRDAVAQWKRKYEFLSTEAPDAYQSAAEK